jgi:hypothetical protein
MFTEVLQKFVPYILFDSREEYYPSPIEFYIANCNIIGPDGNILKNVDMTNLKSIPASHRLQLCNPESRYGFNVESDLNKVPFYTQVIQDHDMLRLIYVLFFPSKGADYICGCILGHIPWWTPDISNTSNVQSVEIDVDKYTPNHIRKITINGDEYNPKILERFDGHPMLYCNLYNHELSPYPQVSFCYCHDEKGHILKSKFIEPIDKLRRVTSLT